MASIVDDAEQIRPDDSMKDCLFYFGDSARIVAAGPAAALPEAAFAGNDASVLFHPSWEQVRDAPSRAAPEFVRAEGCDVTL